MDNQLFDVRILKEECPLSTNEDLKENLIRAVIGKMVTLWCCDGYWWIEDKHVPNILFCVAFVLSLCMGEYISTLLWFIISVQTVKGNRGKQKN